MPSGFGIAIGNCLLPQMWGESQNNSQLPCRTDKLSDDKLEQVKERKWVDIFLIPDLHIGQILHGLENSIRPLHLEQKQT